MNTQKEGPDEPVGFAYSFLVHRRGISLRTNRLSGSQDSGHSDPILPTGRNPRGKGKDPGHRKISQGSEVPKNAKVVEWKDLEIYAGLISPGSSLGLTEINALRPTRDEREVGTHTPAREAWVAVNPDSELIPVARANGVTHSIIAPMGGMISEPSGLIPLDGWGIEEMTIRKKNRLALWWPGHSLGLPQPHAPGQPAPKSMEEQERERKERIREIDEFFDQARHTGKGKKRTPTNWSKTPHGTP